MICQRCGKCCCDSLVIVIHPDFVKDRINLSKLSSEAFLCLNSEPCPHLEWDNDTAVCTIHHYKWYRNTPCYSHGQIETNKNDPCRTGVWMRKNKINIQERYRLK